MGKPLRETDLTKAGFDTFHHYSIRSYIRICHLTYIIYVLVAKVLHSAFPGAHQMSMSVWVVFKWLLWHLKSIRRLASCLSHRFGYILEHLKPEKPSCNIRLFNCFSFVEFL